MKPIRKAVFPVAGMGTRFLPATKASPKEMLPIVDKPLIQYAVEEAVEAGCTEMVFVTGRNKRSIEDHFDKAYELETELEMRHKDKLLEHVRNILPPNITCLYIRQAEALGLGHAVLCARAAIGDEPFAVILADDLIDAPKGALKQMVEVYGRSGNSILGVETVEASQTGSYGIVETEQLKQFQRIIGIVEKTQARRRALQPCRRRTLHPYPAHFRLTDRTAARRGQRNPAYRRHRQAARSRICPGAPL